jgi:hypothetical protein
MNLQLAHAGDGNLWVSGVVRADTGYGFTTLVADGDPAKSRCASSISGPSGGLIGFETQLRDVKSGASVSFSLVADAPFDEGGVYSARLTIGGTQERVDLQVWLPGPKVIRR